MTRDDKQTVNAAKGKLSQGMHGSVDDIRDILFGNQMNEYEKKFTSLEDLMAQKLADIREETRKRLDSLENFVKSEIEALDERLKTERKERLDADKELDKAIGVTNQSLDEKGIELQDQAVKNEKNLRTQILDQSKTLRDEIQQTQEGLLNTIQRLASELRAGKIDRSHMANLLNKMAIAISQESVGEKEGS